MAVNVVVIFAETGVGGVQLKVNGLIVLESKRIPSLYNSTLLTPILSVACIEIDTGALTLVFVAGEVIEIVGEIVSVAVVSLSITVKLTLKVVPEDLFLLKGVAFMLLFPVVNFQA